MPNVLCTPVGEFNTNAVWIPASGLKDPSVAQAASWVDHGLWGAWEFTDNTTDIVVCNIKFPHDMDMTVAPTLQLAWSSTATEKYCKWEVHYLYRQLGEDTSAAADATIDDPDTAGSNKSSATAEGLVITPYTLGVPHASDVCIHLRIDRRGDSVSDTLSDTAELHGVCLSYTSNRLEVVM